MTDMRPVCVPCKTRMAVEKNEVYVKYTDTSVQAGDLFECPACHHQIVSGLAFEGMNAHQYGQEHIDKLLTETVA